MTETDLSKNSQQFKEGDKVKDKNEKMFIVEYQLGNHVHVKNEVLDFLYYPEELTKI